MNTKSIRIYEVDRICLDMISQSMKIPAPHVRIISHVLRAMYPDCYKKALKEYENAKK